jgi:hypothetical protein
LERQEEPRIAPILTGEHLVGIERKHPQQELVGRVTHDAGVGFVQSQASPALRRHREPEQLVAVLLGGKGRGPRLSATLAAFARASSTGVAWALGCTAQTVAEGSA